MKYQIAHCSYHKCLTVYYHRVMDYMYNRILRFSKGYRHFFSSADQFYDQFQNYRSASLNNQSLDIESLGECRITRFIRDPRDLVVSGYLYHKRGAPADDTIKKQPENWCNRPNVTEADWKAINGVIPEGMGSQSFSGYLNSISEEEGLFAELEFRRKHFESMLGWPVEDHRIKLFRYEDVLGKELAVFGEMLKFYGLSFVERWLGLFLARKFSAKQQKGRIEHIRNPTSGQWRERFTPRLKEYFNEKYTPVLEQYGYALA